MISGPKFMPSTAHWTPTTPTLSDAVTSMVTEAERYAPAPGVVIGTVGGIVSPVWAFLTVTLTPDEVVRFPAASRATAVIVCGPFEASVVSHVIEYGAVVSSAPRLTPSRLN